MLQIKNHNKKYVKKRTFKKMKTQAKARPYKNFLFIEEPKPS